MNFTERNARLLRPSGDLYFFPGFKFQMSIAASRRPGLRNFAAVFALHLNLRSARGAFIQIQGLADRSSIRWERMTRGFLSRVILGEIARVRDAARFGEAVLGAGGWCVILIMMY